MEYLFPLTSTQSQKYSSALSALKGKFPSTRAPKRRPLKQTSSDGDSPSIPSSTRQFSSNRRFIRSRTPQRTPRSDARKIQKPSSSSERPTTRSQSFKKPHKWHKHSFREPGIKRSQTDDTYPSPNKHRRKRSPDLARSGSALTSTQLITPQKPTERRSNSISSNRSSRSNSKNPIDTNYSSDPEMNSSHPKYDRNERNGRKGRNATSVSNKDKKLYFKQGKQSYTSKYTQNNRKGHQSHHPTVHHGASDSHSGASMPRVHVQRSPKSPPV